MIYLDNAATTMQKPSEVLTAMRRAFNSFGGAGRGAHQAAMNAANAVYDLREAACELFGAKSPDQVVLTSNATHALNIAIKSFAVPGTRVLVSGLEHNAVMRPLHALGKHGVRYEVVDAPLFDPAETFSRFEKAVKDDVSLVVCTHVSNVFGAVMPVEELSKLCHDKGIPFIVDASQSAGILPVNMQKLPGAVICMPGHKALYGPQGTGLLLAPKGVKLKALMEGGTGSGSMQYTMPEEMPDVAEAGTLNAWGAAGLLEGIRFVLRKKPESIDRQERLLLSGLLEKLYENPRIRCFSHPEHQTGVLSMTFLNADVEDVASRLSDEGIAVRAGLQCAPLAHLTAGTQPDGTLRVSVSVFTTQNELRSFARKLFEIVK